MFKRFFERRKEKLLEQEVANDPTTKLIIHNVQKNWNDVGILSELSSEITEMHQSEFVSIINNILAADNVLEELRLQIMNFVVGYSQYMTLTLTPEYKHHLFTKDSPYVTGELNQYLGKNGTSDLTDKFKEIYFNNPSVSAQELRDFSSLSMAITNFFVEGLDLLRIYLEDYNKINIEKDWLRPFKIAMAESAEYEHREKLGLPQLMDSSMWFRRSIFVKFVLTASNPLMEYEEALKGLDKTD